jgi:hypothetical protein
MKAINDLMLLLLQLFAWDVLLKSVEKILAHKVQAVESTTSCAHW